MIDERTQHYLNSLSLVEVMRNNGYSIDHQTASSVFYRCPFHTEKNGSFAVERRPSEGNAYAGFNCFVCGETAHSRGFGAIMLQKKLLERQQLKSDFPSVVDRLAKDFNLVIDGDYKNGFFHRRQIVDAQEHISFETKDQFSNAELRALGCQVTPVFSSRRNDEGELEESSRRDEHGEVIYKYSFGKEFYWNGCEGNNFDPSLLTRYFNLYPLQSYTTPAKPDEGGVAMRSSRISATENYPIFLFKYEDEKGWWARKYEPYFREYRDSSGRSTGNYKFTWWYQDGKRRTDLSNQVYGDNDVMRALKTGIVETSDEGHPVTMAETRVNGNRTMTKKFERIIICSGPRDAINVFFHSNAHVVYPHSESTEISDALMHKLFSIAKSVYVLYDIDRTGIEQMHRLAFRFIHLRVIYLPEELMTLENPRSGKNCKDAEEFFNFYPDVMRRDAEKSHSHVNNEFEGLIRKAKWMQFWDVRYQSRKNEDGERTETVRNYTINFEVMSQFLSANGFYCYRDESQVEKFVRVKNNIVDIVNPEDALAAARTIMKEFIENHYQYYSEDLANAISLQKKVSREAMSGIKRCSLNFISWGEDYEYFFFRNTAVKVTPESIEQVAYKDLDFQVNRQSIMDYDYRFGSQPLFHIKENPDYLLELKRYEQQMSDKRLTDDEKVKATAAFTAYERLWRFKLSFTDEMDKMPPVLQYLYDISRIHWKREEAGLNLVEEDRQRQDMHFVSKAAAIGYVLSRYRTGKMQKMSVFTDYSVIDEGSSNGGSGKSIIRSLFEQVRKVRRINGKSFKKKENMPKNFQEFRDTVDSLFFIDDLRSDIMGEDFFNVTESITVKTLYNNEVTLPPERTPKIFVTTNHVAFDMNDPSTRRRIILGMVSDYYHPADYSGRIRNVTPATKFGKDIILNATASERQQTALIMMQFCQFYLRLQEDLVPPMEKDGVMRIVYSSVKDTLFIEWANYFFTNPWHFSRPLSINEIVKDYIDYRGEDVNNISIRKNRDDVLRKMRLYCSYMQYSMNPPIVFRSDTSSKYPRHYAWETVFNGDYPATGFARQKVHTRVCFFYRLGDEPKQTHQILPCPDTDEERAEEQRREQEASQ